MQRKEVNKRSPLRLLEASIHGGLGVGKMGFVVARHGIGKTALLVGIALDDLLRGKSVLHVSLEDSVDSVRAYYDEIFQEIVQDRELEDVWKVRADLERHRRIHAYASDGTFTVEKLADTLSFMKESGDFDPSTVIIEGIDFENADPKRVAALRGLAETYEFELWVAATTTREATTDDSGLPDPVAMHEAAADVVVKMAYDGDGVQLKLMKDHDNPSVSDLALALDPRTMLVVRDED